ncbi:hypothetical protein VYU27_009940 [Nannochloropsis oceanica]
MGESASIMLAPYPTLEEVPASWKAPAVEKGMGLIKEVIHAARSLRAQYDIKPQARPSFCVRVSSHEVAALISPQEDDIITLTRAEKVTTVVGGEAPAASGVMIVSESIQVYMELRGMVDASAEIAKLEKQLGSVDQRVQGLERQMNIPGYETKVPANIRENNTNKAEALGTEKANILSAIESFKALMIDG